MSGKEKTSSHTPEAPGLRTVRRRRLLVALFVIALMCFSLAFHLGLGSPSAFGLGTFSLLCPLGGIEALLSSKTFIPRALISFAIVLVICLVTGRAWCAWACPSIVVRKIVGARQIPHAACAPSRASLLETLKSDSRLWVLGGVLLASVLIGLPVFCLVCPIGLSFGTLMSVWRLIQFNDVNWGLLVFPAALVIELVVYKKWCLRICPIAGLLSLVGRLAKPLRPCIDKTVCLHAKGESCKACAASCPEGIDLHASDADFQLADCTRCAECKAVCPTNAISIPLLPKQKD